MGAGTVSGAHLAAQEDAGGIDLQSGPPVILGAVLAEAFLLMPALLTAMCSPPRPCTVSSTILQQGRACGCRGWAFWD